MISIKKVLEADQYIDQVVTIGGWVRSIRNSKKFSFLVVNDGSSFENLQIVVDATLGNYQEVTKLLMGSSVEIKGKVVRAQGGKQAVEMQAQEINIISATDDSYPLQKKATSLEFLREQAHFRPRTNTFNAVFRLRHTLAIATHRFFDER